ncbi:MAG: hypothetical protein N3A38_10785, partial [Planctomycetota bacterium]|nr:hypothetical protein [Planctomycetota bacterium]
VTFASKGRCDVAVAIEDGAGKVVRHLVAGVLGPNAPEPLKPDSLEQTLIWDGKDDRRQYVDEPEKCVARVSLGLSPRFEKLIGWHPKDVDSSRRVSAIAADRDGVYVLSGAERPQLRAYSHDGEYLRTLVPFRADKLEEFKKGDLKDLIKLHDGEVVYYPAGGHAAADGGAGGPRGNYFNLCFDAEAVPVITQRMACAAGKLAVASMGGLVPKQVMRIRTDGSPEGGRLYGPVIGKVKARKWEASLVHNHALASSPDGKWLYVTGLRSGNVSPTYGIQDVKFIHAVYRVDWDAAALPDQPFIGEIEHPRDDGRGFNMPLCVATDVAGNIYVADYGNNRIQIHKPDGTWLHTIQVKAPEWLDVDQKTGAVYVIAGIARGKGAGGGWKFRLLKFSPVPETKLAFDREFDYGPAANDPAFCVDGWVSPPRIWITHRHGEIAVYEDRGDRLELVREFVEDVKKDGKPPFWLSGGIRHAISADPIMGRLYYNGHWRIDPATGRFEAVKLPNIGGDFDEMLIGPDGLAYVRTMKYILRFDPETWRPVPFDYGEEVRGGWGFMSPGGLRFPWPYVFHCQNGFDVSHRGDVLVLGLYSRATKEGRLSLSSDWAMEGFRKGQLRPKDDRDFHPRFYPGRPSMDEAGNILGIWDYRGEERLLDAVGGLYCGTMGVRGDREGNIYLGFCGNLYVDGKPIYGDSLVKFGPQGGKFIYEQGGTIPLKEKPDRPPEFRARGSASGNVWARGQLLWAYGGINEVGSNTSCFCPQTRFAVDWYGRVFVTEAHRCAVAMLDTNGNFVLRLGRYGNADSGRGPDSPIRVGGPEIALAYCSFLTLDCGRRRLYLVDSGNNRIVSVEIAYAVEETAALKEGGE